MCVVSMIHDHFWPQQKPFQPEIVPSKTLQEYLELVRKAHEYDKMTKQPDCIKPEYLKIKEIVEEVLREREQGRNK